MFEYSGYLLWPIQGGQRDSSKEVPSVHQNQLGVNVYPVECCFKSTTLPWVAGPYLPGVTWQMRLAADFGQ